MKHFNAVATLLFTAFAAVAQTSPNTPAATGRPMSLEDCIQQALAHNLDVQIQRYNPQISLYNLNSAYGGYDPTFNLSGQHNHNVAPGGNFDEYTTNPIPAQVTDANSFSSGIGGTLPEGLQYNFAGTIANTISSAYPESTVGSVGVSLTQPLLKNFWIDSTRLAVKVDKNRLKYSEQGLRLQIMTTANAVENAYDELIFAGESVQVEQEALTLAQTQLEQDQQRLQIGTLALLGVQQDQAQVATSQASLIAAQNTESVDQNALKTLLTDSYSQWHDQDIQPTATLTAKLQLFDLQDCWSQGIKLRPDLIQATLNVEQQGIELKYSHNQIFPELNLIGSYGYNGAAPGYGDTFDQFGQGNAPYYSYGAELSIPLSNVNARNQYKSAKATKEQLILQLKQLEQNIMVAIDNAVKLAQSDYESVEATKQARIYAEAALVAEQQTYAVGKATTFEVLQLQNNVTAARSQEIRALANYNEALANLALQEGTTLERNKIDLEAK